MDTSEIVQDLEEKLPEISKQIALRNARLPEEDKQKFLQNLDSPKEHQPMWHQWGIITHSKKLQEYWSTKKFLCDIPKYLHKALIDYLQEEIDGVSKQELIGIALPLHDLGKFNKALGEGKFDFDGHEKYSQQIILEPFVSVILHTHGLTDKQIDYIANCAGKHFELGLLRLEIIESGLGYTKEWVQSDYFTEAVKKLFPIVLGYELEVGLMYLADSWAKVDSTILQEAERLQYRVEQILLQKGLPPELLDAIMQQPINMAVGKRYMRMVLEEENE